jgi:hypothetical protein
MVRLVQVTERQTSTCLQPMARVPWCSPNISTAHPCYSPGFAACTARSAGGTSASSGRHAKRCGMAGSRSLDLSLPAPSQHLPHDAIADEPTAYGQKYVIRATLVGQADARRRSSASGLFVEAKISPGS